MYTHTIGRAKTVLAGALLVLLIAGCSAQPKPNSSTGAGTPSPAPAASPSTSSSNPANTVKLAIGYKAPPISVKDINTGETITLDKLKGQVVVLNFWATWCPPCKAEMPDLEVFQKATQGKVRVVAVGVDTETVEGMKAFAKAQGFTFTIAYDGGKAANTYRAESIPTSYFIDQNGVIRTYAIGAMPLATMRDFYTKTEQQGRSTP